MQESTYDIHPGEARWTHVALRVDDIDAHDRLLHVDDTTRTDRQAPGRPGLRCVARYAGRDRTTRSSSSSPSSSRAPTRSRDAPKEVLAPFAHLGIELPTKDAVDDIAERAAAADCLAMPPTMMPPPIGYICMVSDPDGNMVEFSWDQGVYATLRDRFGDPPVTTGR